MEVLEGCPVVGSSNKGTQFTCAVWDSWWPCNMTLEFIVSFLQCLPLSWRGLSWGNSLCLELLSNLSTVASEPWLAC